MNSSISSRRGALAAAAFVLLSAFVNAEVDVASARAGSRPSLLESTFFAVPGSDALVAVAADLDGNTFVAGLGGFPPHLGAVPVVLGSSVDDPYIAKLSPEREVLSLTYLGGSGPDGISDLGVDAAGNIYIAGTTQSSDFPVVAPPVPPAAFAESMVYVAKIDAAGSRLVYSTLLGRYDAGDQVRLAVTPDGVATVVTTTRSHEWPVANAVQPALNGYQNAVVTSVAADGSHLVFSTYLGSDLIDWATDVAVDAAGDVYVTGRSTGAGAIPGAQPLFPSRITGFDDGFVVKLAADGSAIRYATIIGGRNLDSVSAIAVDAAGSAYVTGRAQKPLEMDRYLQTTGTVNHDYAYVIKLSPDGARPLYATAVSGGAGDEGRHIAVDARGAATVVGVTASLTFPVTNAWQNEISYDRRYTRPAEEIFVAKLTPAGTAFAFATYHGGVGEEFANAIATDAVGVSWVVGATDSKDFPLVGASQQHPGDGQENNGFLLRFASSPPPSVSSARFTEKPSKGLRLRLSGAGFRPGLKVFVGADAEPWPAAKVTATSVTLKGDALDERLPSGVPVRLRFVNADGVGAFYTVTR